ncbi:hypothetical protein Drorol1_Dr00005954 [Drosera rotundifolia]
MGKGAEVVVAAAVEGEGEGWVRLGFRARVVEPVEFALDWESWREEGKAGEKRKLEKGSCGRRLRLEGKGQHGLLCCIGFVLIQWLGFVVVVVIIVLAPPPPPPVSVMRSQRSRDFDVLETSMKLGWIELEQEEALMSCVVCGLTGLCLVSGLSCLMGQMNTRPGPINTKNRPV